MDEQPKHDVQALQTDPAELHMNDPKEEHQNDPAEQHMNDPTEKQKLDQSLPSAAPVGVNVMEILNAMEAAFTAAALPADELTELDFSERVDASLRVRDLMTSGEVEKNVKDFMENAKKLQQHFISLGRPDPSTRANPASRADKLQKEIALLEAELKEKDAVIQKTEKQFEGWKNELKEQLGKHITELKRV